MTKFILNYISKKYKINLNLYDSVNCWIDDSTTWIYVQFGCAEVVGGNKKMCNVNTIKISFNNILKKFEEDVRYDYTDFETDGWIYIDYIK